MLHDSLTNVFAVSKHDGKNNSKKALSFRSDIRSIGTRSSNGSKKHVEPNNNNNNTDHDETHVSNHRFTWASTRSGNASSRTAQSLDTGYSTDYSCPAPHSASNQSSGWSSSIGYWSNYEADDETDVSSNANRVVPSDVAAGHRFVSSEDEEDDADRIYDDDDDADKDENGDVVLAVFFEGTASTIDPVCTQIGIFYELCRAIPLSTAKDVGVETDERVRSGRLRRRYKMAFDGCGVTNGIRGLLFGAGLDRQCDRVVEVVAALRERFPLNSFRVVSVGQSRGGVACFKLVRKLSKRFDNRHRRTRTKQRVRNDDDDNSWLTVSACLFDPVPGNALSTGFPFTAVRSMDLRRCRCLRRVLALYPYEPLPDYTFHAPCLLRYHPDTRVEEDVTLGCHQGALFRTALVPVEPCDVASNLSFRRLSDFFQDEGVSMKRDKSDDLYVTIKRRRLYRPTLEHCVKLCRGALREHLKDFDDDGDDRDNLILRRTHDRTRRRRLIVRRFGNNECTFLNRHHEQLEMALRHARLQQQGQRYGKDRVGRGSFSCNRNEDVDVELSCNGNDVLPVHDFFSSVVGSDGQQLHTYQLDLRTKYELSTKPSFAPLACAANVFSLV